MSDVKLERVGSVRLPMVNAMVAPSGLAVYACLKRQVDVYQWTSRSLCGLLRNMEDRSLLDIETLQNLKSQVEKESFDLLCVLSCAISRLDGDNKPE